MSRRDHLSRLDMHDILMSQLDWNAQQRLESFAPTHLPVPSGSRIPIDYTERIPDSSPFGCRRFSACTKRRPSPKAACR